MAKERLTRSQLVEQSLKRTMRQLKKALADAARSGDTVTAQAGVIAETQQQLGDALVAVDHLNGDLDDLSSANARLRGIATDQADRLGYNQEQLDSCFNRINVLEGRLDNSNFKLTIVTEDFRRAQEQLAAEKSTTMMLADRLHKEVDARAREQVLLVALMAALGSNRVDKMVDTVRVGAREALVDESVALEVFDKYLRREVVDKVDREEDANMREVLANLVEGPSGLDLSDAAFAREYSQ